MESRADARQTFAAIGWYRGASDLDGAEVQRIDDLESRSGRFSERPAADWSARRRICGSSTTASGPSGRSCPTSSRVPDSARRSCSRGPRRWYRLAFATIQQSFAGGIGDVARMTARNTSDDGAYLDHPVVTSG
ncbi:MAG: hypothetical protein V5A54_02695 [Haloarculaceae archaeon]